MLHFYLCLFIVLFVALHFVELRWSVFVSLHLIMFVIVCLLFDVLFVG